MAAQRREYGMPVHAMMARLGIEPGSGAVPRWGLRYATALRRCEHCQCRNSCRDWLDCAPALVNFAPDFCVNAELLFELQYEQPGPRRCDERI
jgi:hypothetical protein